MINGLLNSINDPMAKTKVTLKEGDQTITVERTPEQPKEIMSIVDVIAPGSHGLLGGEVSGFSPTPVADNIPIDVTAGEFVVNQPAAQKYAGLLEDINNEGQEMLARGGWTGPSKYNDYAGGGKVLSDKISKIYNEGYKAPGQAYAIAKNMGYNQGGYVEALKYYLGGEVMPQLSPTIASSVRQHFAIGGQVDPAASMWQQTAAAAPRAIGRDPFRERQWAQQDDALARQRQLQDRATQRAQTLEDYERSQADLIARPTNVEEAAITLPDGTTISSRIAIVDNQQKYWDPSALEWKPLSGDIKVQSRSGSSGFSKRALNITYRDHNGLQQVVAGARGPDGYYVDTPQGLKPFYEIFPDATDVRIAPSSEDPGVERGAGDIPNAVYYDEDLRAPSFNFQREGESKAYGYAMRAVEADANLASLESTLIAQGEQQALGELYTGLANWAARNSTDSITGAVLTDIINSAAEKAPVLNKYRRDMAKYLQAVLRSDTGAAYTGTEIADYIQAFGVVPGESVTPELLAQLQRGRQLEIQSMAARTGKAAPYVIGLLSGKYELPTNRPVKSYGKDGEDPLTPDPLTTKNYDYDLSI